MTLSMVATVVVAMRPPQAERRADVAQAGGAGLPKDLQQFQFPVRRVVLGGRAMGVSPVVERVFVF